MSMQVISIAGALMVLSAYGLHQFDRLAKETYTYQLLNFVGGAALVAAAFTTLQAGLIIMEGAWTVISLAGLIKLRLRLRSSRSTSRESRDASSSR